MYITYRVEVQLLPAVSLFLIFLIHLQKKLFNAIRVRVRGISSGEEKDEPLLNLFFTFVRVDLISVGYGVGTDVI